MQPQKFHTEFQHLYYTVTQREWVYYQDGEIIENGTVIRACNSDTAELMVSSTKACLVVPVTEIGYDFSTKTGYVFSEITTKGQAHLTQEQE